MIRRSRMVFSHSRRQIGRWVLGPDARNAIQAATEPLKQTEGLSQEVISARVSIETQGNYVRSLSSRRARKRSGTRLA